MRLPGKIFSDVAGTPFLKRLIDRMKLVERQDGIVICTSAEDSDAKLRAHAPEWGVNVYGGSLEDVMLRLIESGRQFNATNVVRVTGDNLFTSPVMLDFLLETHERSGADFTKIDGLPLGVNADVISLAALEDVYSNLPADADSEYIQLYTYDPARYRCLIHDAPEELMHPELSLTMDYERDLEMVRFVIENLGDSFCIHEVIALLEQTNRAIFLAHDTSIKVPGGVKDWGEYKAYMSDIRSAANAVIDPSQFDHLRPDPKRW